MINLTVFMVVFFVMEAIIISALVLSLYKRIIANIGENRRIHERLKNIISFSFFSGLLFAIAFLLLITSYQLFYYNYKYSLHIYMQIIAFTICCITSIRLLIWVLILAKKLKNTIKLREVILLTTASGFIGISIPVVTYLVDIIH